MSGSWSNAGNWSSNPALPAAGDNVVIDPPGATITVTHDQGSDSLASLLCNENLVLAGGALSVSASSQVTGSLTVAMGVLLAASGSAATLTANGPAIIDGSNLSASGGGQLNLPTATTYIYAGSAAFASPYLTASGANSDLNLSGVTTIAGSTGAFNTLTVSGLSGGYVDLHNLTGLTGFTGAFSQLTITASSGGYVDLRNLPNYTTGSVQVLADGAHSVVNLSGMTSFSASNATNGAASITARNGGTVLMGSLTALNLVNIVMDGTGTMATSQIVSYTNGTATISGVAPNFSGLTNAAGSTFNLSGSVALMLNNAANLAAATFNLNGGATVNLPDASDIDGASFNVAGGVTLSVPDATSYVERRTSAFLNDYLTAGGSNSVLNLSSLTTISGSTGAFATLTISATGGGHVDLHNLTSLTGYTGAFGQLNITASNGGYVDLRNLPSYTTGTVQVLADGTNSVVNLSSLTSFSASNAANGPASITASNGGTILLGPSTVPISGTSVSAGSGGTITAGGLQIQNTAILTIVPGGTLNMASLQLSGGTIAGNGPLSQPVTGSGGTLQPAAAASSLTFNGPVVVSGPLTMAGSGTLTLAASGNSSTGVTVSAGTLLVNGSLSAGAGTVAVQAGAALGGSGAVSSPTNFAAGSIFAPGNFGRFTLGNSSLLDGTLDWDLESLRDNQNGTPGVDFSQVLLANGNVNSANLILALSFPGSTSPDDDSPFWDQGHAWTVVDNVGTGTETFSGLTISGYGTNGAGAEGAFSTNVGNGPGGDLVLNWTSSVPEPCTLALLSVGAIGLLGGAWRRSKQARAATSSPPVEGPVLSGDGERDSGPAILSMPSRWIEPARRAA